MANLDQFVKGKSPGIEQIGAVPNVVVLPEKDSSLPKQDSLISPHSSPHNIYINLLIFEASLRVQWLELRTRRRQHTFFLTLLALWIMYFGYALFLAPREDGSGVGGSVYWVVEVVEKLCFLGGLVTGVLVWGTGQWERGIRWPRRWVYCTNRGLRGFNCKIVVIKQPWWIEIYSIISFLFSYCLFASNSGSTYRYTDQLLLKENRKLTRSGLHNTFGARKDIDIENCEQDIAPGGDYIKLLLLPKSFSAKFREDWDIFRTEYWEKENERRSILRKALYDRERKIAKQQGGFIWWIGFRGWNRTKYKINDRANNSLHKYSLGEREKSRFRSTSLRSALHSWNSSQDVAATYEVGEEGSKGHIRGSSSASTFPGKRRKGASGKRQMQTISNSRPSILENSTSSNTHISLSGVSPVDSEVDSISAPYAESPKSRRESASRKNGSTSKHSSD